MTAHEILHAVTSGAIKPHQIPADQVAELKEVIIIELEYIDGDIKEIDMTLFPHGRVDLGNKKRIYQVLLAIL